MARAEKLRAKYLRTFLIELLGAKCAHCGTTIKLEFDCIIATGDSHHKKDTSARISFYRAQLRGKNLQLLCSKCNGRKGNGPDKLLHPEEYRKEQQENEPF